MNFKKNETITKLRGGYYTPIEVASFLARWALNKKPNSILEPSCGDGVFIEALKDKLDHSITFTGLEIYPEEAEKARTKAKNNEYLNAEILGTDFLSWSLTKFNNTNYDAVVGNPPYIRYQYLENNQQLLSEQIFNRFNLHFTKHTNAWVPFIIASIALLRPGGRLAMVIPSEIFHVLHASSLRQFMLRECSSILLIDPTMLLFKEALQGTVLLLIERKLNPDIASKGVAVISAQNNDFLMQNPETYIETAFYVSGEVLNGKWMKVLLEPNELQVYEQLRTHSMIKRFKDLASVDVGIVTGANNFFLIPDQVVQDYGLQEWVKPMFGRSEHCPGIIYSATVHENNKKVGLPTNFLHLGETPLDKLPRSVQDYLAIGEQQELNLRYKCRIRSPWWNIPSVYASKVGMLKRSHNFPRLILNTLGAYTTDTAYRIKPLNIDAEKLVYVFVNSLTALSAELEGRHYGGGVLELVPSEIEKLYIPFPKNLKIEIEKLDSMVRMGINVDELLSIQDNIILRAIDLCKQDIETLHNAMERIRNRRQRLIIAE